MDSSSKSNGDPESSTTLSSESTISGSEHDRTVLMRSRKEFDLASSSTQSSPINNSNASIGRNRAMDTASDHMKLLWRRSSPTTHESSRGGTTEPDGRKVGCSVPRIIGNKKVTFTGSRSSFPVQGSSHASFGAGGLNLITSREDFPLINSVGNENRLLPHMANIPRNTVQADNDVSRSQSPPKPTQEYQGLPLNSLPVKYTGVNFDTPNAGTSAYNTSEVYDSEINVLWNSADMNRLQNPESQASGVDAPSRLPERAVRSVNMLGHELQGSTGSSVGSTPRIQYPGPTTSRVGSLNAGSFGDTHASLNSERFRMLRGATGSINIRADLESSEEETVSPQHNSTVELLRTSRGSTDIFQLMQHSADDEIYNIGHPAVRNARARMNLPGFNFPSGEIITENVLRNYAAHYQQDPAWERAGSSRSEEIQITDMEDADISGSDSQTNSVLDDIHRGTLLNLRIEVQRSSSGSSAGGHRIVEVIGGTKKSFNLPTRNQRSMQEIVDNVTHPHLLQPERVVDLPGTASHRYPSRSTGVRMILDPTNSSCVTVSTDQLNSTEVSAVSLLSRPEVAKENEEASSENDGASAGATGAASTSAVGTNAALEASRVEERHFTIPEVPNKAAKSAKENTVNFVWSTSEFDLIYDHNSARSGKGSAFYPGIKSPEVTSDKNGDSTALEVLWKASEVKYILHPDSTNCKYETTSNFDFDSLMKPPETYQVYVASTRKVLDEVKSSDSSHDSTHRASLEQSGSEPSSYSSSSDANTDSSKSLVETREHTGSTHLIENLPGLDGQKGQFNKPLSNEMTAQNQADIDEILKMATRSKHYVPPMELGFNEWESIIQVLTMNEPRSVFQVLCRLCKMSSKRHCDLVKFYKCRLYENILPLALNTPEIPLVQNLSLKLIADLSILPECRQQILQTPELVYYCMNLLADDAVRGHLHEYSSKVLSGICRDKSLQELLLNDHDLVEVLLRRISSTADPDVRCNCMEIMLRVGNNETICHRVINSPTFSLDLFVTLIGSAYSKIQQLSLGMLVLLTRYVTQQEFQEKVKESGLAELMVHILTQESMADFAHLVIAILCNIANTEFGLSFLRYSGALKFLIEYIDQEGKEDILGCGLDIVVKLSMSKGGRALLVEFEAPEKLVKYLKYEEDTTLERSCVALANVCQNLEALCVIVSQRPAEDLIRLIYDDKNSSQLKYSAAKALLALAGRDEDMCQQIAELRLTEVFYHIIWAGFAHVETLGTISDIIQIISQYPALKPLMIDDESVACFLDIIQGHCREFEVSEEDFENEEALRISGLQCLRAYMSDPECRKLFSNAFGVYVLRGNLQGTSILIRQATAVFIELAAKDQNLAAEMVVAGIVEIMRADKQMMAACPAWKKGLQQIYNSHLPTKFAYCNRLELSDITGDGFYVCANKKGKIEVLDNLLHERLCPRESIYVCNFSTEQPKPDLSIHVIMRPKWHPYVKRPSCNSHLSKLGDRSVAKIWRRKVSLLYGERSPNRSCENSLEISPNDSPNSSLTFGRSGIARTRTSSLNRRLKGRKNKYQGRSLSSVKSYFDLPNLSETNYAEFNVSMEKYAVCPVDVQLGTYLELLLEQIQEVLGDAEVGQEDSRNSFMADKGLGKLAEIVAKFVAARMSGNTDSCSNMINFFSVSVWELKERYGTNIIPLGHLRAGLYLERALLFKVLSDRIGLPCSFVRGEYGRAYNEICIPCPNNDFPLQWQRLIPNFVVDLMHNVGELYFVESRQASEYCNTPT